MGKVDRAKFLEDAKSRSFGGRGRYSDWKKVGETDGHIHPVIGIWERWSHGAIPSVEENKDEKEVVRNRRPNCIGTSMQQIPNNHCPMCVLKEFAIGKKKGGVDPKEIILEAGSGKTHQAYDLGEISGDGNYMTELKAKQEVVFAWIKKDADTSDLKKSIEIISGPQTLGERIIEVVTDEIKNRGEIKGDIEVHAGWKLKMKKGNLVLISDDGETEVDWSPYPLKLKYKEDALPATKYGVSKLDRDLCPITPEKAQVMLATPEELEIDLEKTCMPTPIEKQMEIIKSSWSSNVIPFEEFEEFFETRSGKTLDKEKKEEKKTESKAEKPTDGTIFCPECGAKNENGAKFCKGCGGKLAGKDAEKPKEKAEPKESKPKTAEEPAKKSAKRWKCGACGEAVEPMKPSNRCPECGEKIDVESDTPF